LKQLSVREARAQFCALIDAVSHGETVVITRHGRKIAGLFPFQDAKKKLPAMKKFRESISIKGDSLSRTVIKQRNEERY
jgi:prevent-host-death family protein